MYIKCNTPEQLDEIIKYYNITNQMWIKLFLKDSNSIGINSTGEFNLERKGLDYITFSQWQLQTLRDLGFDTDLAEDMLSRCDKFKRNDMNKKDQFIQLEGGKLNITKARELGLWVEDKKVFTINETNEIQYNEYKIKSTVNTFWKRVVKIFKNDELIVELINPTPDKLLSEFAYYGIEVSVE